MNSWLLTKMYASTQFNVPTQCPIMRPSPDPCPAGDRLFKLRVSYVGTISQTQF